MNVGKVKSKALIFAWVFFLGIKPTLSDNWPEIVTARDGARKVLEIHCGACHLPNVPLPDLKALSIYDLSNPNWPTTLNKRQLEELVTRIKDRQKMTAKELVYVVPKGVSPPVAPTPKEVRSVEQFVQLEVTSRNAAF